MTTALRTYGRASSLSLKRAQNDSVREDCASSSDSSCAGGDGLPARAARLVLQPRADGRAAKRPAVRPSGSSATSSSESKRLTQSFLDFGQRDFHSVLCSLCGMRYARGLAEDDKDHAIFCKSFQRFVFVKSVSPEAVVASRVRYATPGSKGVLDCVVSARAGLRHKFDKLLDKFIVPELGTTVDVAVGPASNILLYVADDGCAVGAVVFDCITAAYPVITPSCQPSSASITCSTAEEPARVGVRLLWTHSRFRRQGLASALLDAARRLAVPPDGCSKQECAFAQPTPDGALLAQSYTGSPTVLVYVPQCFSK